MKINIKGILLLCLLFFVETFVYSQYNIITSAHADCQQTFIFGQQWVRSQPMSNTGMRAVRGQITNGPGNSINITVAKRLVNEPFICRGAVKLFEITNPGTLAMVERATFVYGFGGSPCAQPSYTFNYSSNLPSQMGQYKVYALILYPTSDCSNNATCVGADNTPGVNLSASVNNVSQYSITNGHWMGYWVVYPEGNNNSCDAQYLSTGTSCNYNSYTNQGATNSSVSTNSLCGNYQGKDVWFKATVPSNGAIIAQANAISFSNGAMAAYSGSCNNLTFERCDDNDGPGLMPRVEVVNLTPNSTVYFRFWEYGGNQSGSFNICTERLNVNASQPTAGTTWNSGDIMNIQWTTDVQDFGMRVELYKSGSFYSTIAGQASSSPFNWTIPTNIPGGNDY